MVGIRSRKVKIKGIHKYKSSDEEKREGKEIDRDRKRE